jgi:ribosomal protein S18 acetylase RimI-like enzyme
VSDGLRTSLRAVHPGDIRALAAAEVECFDDAWPEPYIASELFAPARFHRVLVDPGGRLAAYLFAAWQYLDLHILKVATLPPFRRLGLGTKLMLVAEEHARAMEGETVTLEVRVTNIAAIGLYESLGYQRMGVRPGYYADASDALIMTKAIRRTKCGGASDAPIRTRGLE